MATPRKVDITMGDIRNIIETGIINEYIHEKQGITHNLIGNSLSGNIKFPSTADFERGDLFTVNGVSVEASFQNGLPLDAKYFKEGNWVNCIYDGKRLNFKSDGGASLSWVCNPIFTRNPREGDIWIQADVRVDSVILTPNLPEIAEPYVLYIGTGAFSQTQVPIVKFSVSANAVISAKPVDYYLSDGQGHRVYHAVDIWTGSSWFTIPVKLFYDNGDERTNITGGWIRGATYTNSSRNTVTFSKESACLRLRSYNNTNNSNIFSYGSFQTYEKIDMSAISRLCVAIDSSCSTASSTNIGLYVAVISNFETGYSSGDAVTRIGLRGNYNGTITLDTIAINKPAYIRVLAHSDDYSDDGTISITKVWGE